MEFWLGTHHPRHLAETSVPLFVSRTRLETMNRLPRAQGPWALDSGAFSELVAHPRWTVRARDYVDQVLYWRETIGNLQWIAIQDWMCEPLIRNGGFMRDGTFVVGTRLSVQEHQERTIASYLELQGLAPQVPWLPVLQGWQPDDYLAHIDMYRAAGVNLQRMPLVGVGSVCRRQKEEEGLEVIRPLAALGLRLHGFGFKITGLRNGGSQLLRSADSMAWSYAARRQKPLPGCYGHKNCANCLRFALLWRQKVLRAIEEGEAVPSRR